MDADFTLTLPADDGTANQILETDGSGNLSWTDNTGVANGTVTNNTLRWNGTAWLESTALTNDGTDVSASGNITATGDVAVNGGDITTTAGTANLVNTNATTVNIAGASTATAIGAATGTTTIGNDLAVTNDATITGDATVSGADLTLGEGTTAAAGSIVLHDADGGDSNTTILASNADVAASFTLTLPADDGDANQVLTTDGSGALSWTDANGVTDGTAASNTLRWNGSIWEESAALTNDGTDVAASGNITATGDVAVNGGDITTTAGTANIVNTNATTVNIAGASTATAIGAATGTTTIGNDLTATGDTTVTGGDITVGAGTTAKQGAIVLHDNQAADSFTTTIQAADDVNASYTLTLPADDGTANQVLTTDGSGALSWADANGVTDGTAANNTLRWNGSDWVESTALTNDGTDVSASGNITATGDVAVNGGDIISTATALNVDVGDTGTIALRDGTNNLLTVVDNGTTGNVTATGTLTASGGSVTTGSDGTDGSLVIYSEQGGTDYSYTINPNASATQDVTLTLPADDGTANQVLTTDGSGALSWADANGVTDGTAANNTLRWDGSDWVESTALTNDGTKIGIGTDTIPHGGIGRAKIAIEGADSNAAGPHVQYTTSADNYPVFTQLNWSHDSISLLFDAYTSAINGVWKSSDAGSNYAIRKIDDELTFQYESGVAAGNDIAWNNALTIANNGNVNIGIPMNDAALAVRNSGSETILNLYDAKTNVFTVIDGGNVGIGTTSPGSELDVKGTLRLSGSTSGYVGFAPAAAAGSTIYTLPAADGTSGQVLSTNGSGALSWSAITGTVADGTAANNTLRWNGTAWIESTALTNDGTDVSASGNITATGDVAVNGGDITSTATILNMDVANTGTIALRDGTNNLLTVVDNGSTGNVTATGTLTASGGSVTTGSDGTDGSLVVYSEQGATDYTYTISPNAAATQNVTLTLPADDGTANQVLTTDGAGALSWSDSLTDTLTSANIFVGNGSNVATGVAMSGDVAIDNTGATTVQTDAVALATDTTGNYVATIADAGNTVITVANSGTENAAVTLDITDGGVVEDDLAASLAFDDGDLLNLSAVNASSTAEGIILPQAADVSAATAEGQITWDTDNDTLYVGDGTAAQAIGGDTSIYSDDGTLTGARTVTMGTNNLSLTSTGGDLNVDSGTLYVDASTNRVGIGTDSPDNTFHVNGGMIVTGIALATATGLGLSDEGDYKRIQSFEGEPLVLNPISNLVGIGVTAPDGKLEVRNSGTEDILNLYDGTTNVLSVLDGGDTWIDSSTTFFVDASTDRVGIGTSSPGSELDVQGTLRLSGSTSGYVGFAPAAAAGSTTYTLPTADGTSGQVLSTDGAGALNWTSISGTVADGTSSNNTLRWDGSNWVESTALTNDGTAGTGYITVANNLRIGSPSIGHITVDGSDAVIADDVEIDGDLWVDGTFSAPSDIRLKTNITTLSDVLTKIGRLRAVRYEFKDQDTYASGPQIGLIAQELQEVFPELVTEGADGYLAINYTRLSAVLVQAINEQQRRIDILTNRIDKQQAQINELYSRLNFGQEMK